MAPTSMQTLVWALTIRTHPIYKMNQWNDFPGLRPHKNDPGFVFPLSYFEKCIRERSCFIIWPKQLIYTVLAPTY